MTDAPRYFTDFSEIKARPDFDQAAVVTTASFRTLIGMYRFEAEVMCQVFRGGVLCRHPHLEGWLGKNSDGVEILIGGHCAQKYFNAVATFAAERGRVKRQLNLDDLLRRIGELVEGRNVIRGELARGESQVCEIIRAVEKIRLALPSSVLRRLSDMAKTGRSEITVEVRYVEPDEKGRPVYSWLPRTIGAIDGAKLLNRDEHAADLVKIREARRALENAEASESLGSKRLKLVIDQIDTGRAAIAKVSSTEALVARFCEPTNLGRLCFSTRNDDDRLKTADFVCAKTQGDSTDRSRAQRFLRENEARLRAEFGGRDFRIA